MTVESANYINQLQPLNPDGADQINEGDDNIRVVKKALVQSFPNVGGIVSATHTELAYSTGVTSSIQTQLNAKAPLASPALTGIPTAPTATGANNQQIVNEERALQIAAVITTITDLTPVAVNAAGTSTAQTREYVDTSSIAITRNLPPTPTLWQLVAYKDAKATWHLRALTLNPGANRVEDAGIGELVVCNNKYGSTLLQWDGSVWRVLA